MNVATLHTPNHRFFLCTYRAILWCRKILRSWISVFNRSDKKRWSGVGVDIVKEGNDWGLSKMVSSKGLSRSKMTSSGSIKSADPLSSREKSSFSRGKSSSWSGNLESSWYSVESLLREDYLLCKLDDAWARILSKILVPGKFLVNTESTTFKGLSYWINRITNTPTAVELLQLTYAA